MAHLRFVLSIHAALVLVILLSARVSGKAYWKKIEDDEFDKIISKITSKHRGCQADVCFMIDGSTSIPSYDYAIQIDFVKFAAFFLQTTSSKTRFAALQYGGTPADVLSPLTHDLESFVEAVSSAPAGRYNVTHMGPALLFCSGLLEKGKARKKHIVVLGDGRTNFGPTDGPLGPVALGKAFRSKWGSGMTAVAVGFADIKELSSIVGGWRKVLQTKWWGPKVLRSTFVPLMDSIC